MDACLLLQFNAVLVKLTGIRLNKNSHDQKRILTPKKAFKNGSNWLVIGRPITQGNIKHNMIKLIDHLNK